MSTDNIDDLFRSQLDGHETPPGDDLWARLQAGPGAAAPAPGPAPTAPERLDQLFQLRLHAHATPVPREIWERLEDEHLRPRKRRAAAWWPMAMAAAIAVLLLAGGAGYWFGFPAGQGAAGSVATQQAQGPTSTRGPLLITAERNAAAGKPSKVQSGMAANSATVAAALETATSEIGQPPNQALATGFSASQQKNTVGRATRLAGLASSASKGGMLAQQSPRHQQDATRQPDAAAPSTPLMARTTAPTSNSPQPADEPTLAVAAATLPAPGTTPAVENVPVASTSSASALAATVITVDVRNGAPRRPSLATAVATAAASEDRPGLGGRLLRQVGRAVRGERISISEVTGLPENLTVEANIAGRRVSKSIQL